MCPGGRRRITAKRRSTDEPAEVYHGVLRRFEDGLWGALFFEIGVMAMARPEDEAIRQAIDLLEFERARSGPDEVPVGPITLEALGEFMAPDPSARRKKGAREEISVAPEFTVSPFEYATA